MLLAMHSMEPHGRHRDFVSDKDYAPCPPMPDLLLVSLICADKNYRPRCAAGRSRKANGTDQAPQSGNLGFDNNVRCTEAYPDDIPTLQGRPDNSLRTAVEVGRRCWSKDHYCDV